MYYEPKVITKIKLNFKCISSYTYTKAGMTCNYSNYRCILIKFREVIYPIFPYEVMNPYEITRSNATKWLISIP